MPRREHDGKTVDPDRDPLYRKRAAWKKMKEAADGAGHHLLELLKHFEDEPGCCPRLLLAVALQHWLNDTTKEDRLWAWRCYWDWSKMAEKKGDAATSFGLAASTDALIAAIVRPGEPNSPRLLGWEVVNGDAWLVTLSRAPLVDGEGMAVGFELDRQHHVICLSPAVAGQHRDTALATAIERIREDATRGESEAA